MIKKDNKFMEIQRHVFRYKIKRVRMVSKRFFLELTKITIMIKN